TRLEANYLYFCHVFLRMRILPNSLKPNNSHIFLVTLFFLQFFVVTKPVYSQVSCEIMIDSPMPVCPGVTFGLSVLELDNQVYEWYENGKLLSGDDKWQVLVKIDTTTSFTVKVTDTITSETCESEPFEVEVYPKIKINFNQVQKTCSNGDNDNGNTAKVFAIASGAFPSNEYHYFWDVAPIQIAPGDSSLAIGLKANLKYTITVKDNYSCATQDTVQTKAYSNPKMEIFYDPNDTIYIQNPYVTFSFENLSADSIALSNFFWDFGDCDLFENSDCANDLSRTQQMPTHEYSIPIKSDTTYYPTLTVFNPQGCDTVYTGAVMVYPVKLFIPNIFTPNGDAANQYFEITLDDENKDVTKPINLYYERTELTVINRQGRIIFQSSNYQNDWDGGKYPDGVYFYVLKCYGALSTDTYKGSVTIYGSGR
ncbi:MAG TPA: gliding motility-associated C-terminal domain-containing protein, partial [Bacteroidales bacterium]